jgi:hypothetical protein
MTEDAKPDDEPKIIVDDDWKSQVEKEKEELKKQSEAPADSQPGPESMEMPPASFMVLLSTLATQAMAALGLVPDPLTGKPNVNRPIAKHFIDTLAMLQEKTKGNLTDEESAHLRDGLHQLRMAYVSTENLAPGGEDKKPEKPSSIELP